MEFHRGNNAFVGQVELKVENLENSLSFYQNLMGFSILEKIGNRAVLTADGKIPLLSLEQPEDVIPRQRRTAGLYHFAILLPTRQDLGSVLNHLLQAGYPLQGGSDHLVSEALYLADPDGNGIEIYADRPSSSWEWKNGEVLMVTDPLDAESLLQDGRSVPWKGLPADSTVGHIHLHVSDLESSEEFYVHGLGFDVVSRYGGQALFVSTGKYHHHIGLNTWNGAGAPPPAKNSAGLKRFTLEYPDEAERNKAAEQLRKIGSQVKEENGIVAAVDPSGNEIHLRVFS